MARRKWRVKCIHAEVKGRKFEPHCKHMACIDTHTNRADCHCASCRAHAPNGPTKQRFNRALCLCTIFSREPRALPCNLGQSATGLCTTGVQQSRLKQLANTITLKFEFYCCHFRFCVSSTNFAPFRTHLRQHFRCTPYLCSLKPFCHRKTYRLMFKFRNLL